MRSRNWPQALFGGELCGDRLMRIVYLDESGIGREDKDPVLVVAGVIINADMHWLKLQAHLRTLLEDATPKGVPVPKALHAKDIWHGTKDFHRDVWPREARLKLLDQLACVPRDYGLTVVWGALKRTEFKDLLDQHPDRDRLVGLYCIASMICFIMAEEYMRLATPPDEVASVVFEQNSDLQKKIPRMYELASSPEVIERIGESKTGFLPLSRIIDTPTFQTKTQSSILQVADFCAFAIKRFEQGAKGAEGWYRLLEPRMSRVRKDSPYYVSRQTTARAPS